MSSFDDWEKGVENSEGTPTATGDAGRLQVSLLPAVSSPASILRTGRSQSELPYPRGGAVPLDGYLDHKRTGGAGLANQLSTLILEIHEGR